MLWCSCVYGVKGKFPLRTQHTATQCNTLYHSVCVYGVNGDFPLRTLQHTATQCNTLHHSVCVYGANGDFPLRTLQHTATHCNTVQHTAPQCVCVWGRDTNHGLTCVTVTNTQQMAPASSPFSPNEQVSWTHIRADIQDARSFVVSVEIYCATSFPPESALYSDYY